MNFHNKFPAIYQKFDNEFSVRWLASQQVVSKMRCINELLRHLYGLRAQFVRGKFFRPGLRFSMLTKIYSFPLTVINNHTKGECHGSKEN